LRENYDVSVRATPIYPWGVPHILIPPLRAATPSVFDAVHVSFTDTEYIGIQSLFSTARSFITQHRSEHIIFTAAATLPDLFFDDGIYIFALLTVRAVSRSFPFDINFKFESTLHVSGW
jgi:hypothetical protein